MQSCRHPIDQWRKRYISFELQRDATPRYCAAQPSKLCVDAKPRRAALQEVFLGRTLELGPPRDAAELRHSRGCALARALRVEAPQVAAVVRDRDQPLSNERREAGATPVG